MPNQELVTQINNAIGAHGSWKIKLRTAVNTGKSEHSVADVRCDDKCAFGLWLHGTDLKEETRVGVPYKVIKRLHAEFHTCAAEVLKNAISGQKAEAEELLEGEYATQSAKLVRGLRKWKRELS